MEVVWLVDFHLPADTIPLQDLRGWEGQFGKRGEHDNVLRKLQGLRLYLLSFARGLLAYFVMRYPDRFFRFSDRTHPPRQHDPILAHRLGGPRFDDARSPQRGERREQVERCALSRLQHQRTGIHPHGDLPSRGNHMMNPEGGGVTAIGQNILTRLNRELGQRFARASTRRFGELEEVTHQRGQANAIVNAPQRPRLAGLLDGRRIKGPDLKAAIGRHRNTLFPEQLQT